MRSIELSEPHTVLCEVLAIFADVYKLGTYAMLSVWCSILLLCARATQVQELEFRSRQGPLGRSALGLSGNSTFARKEMASAVARAGEGHGTRSCLLLLPWPIQTTVPPQTVSQNRVLTVSVNGFI